MWEKTKGMLKMCESFSQSEEKGMKKKRKVRKVRVEDKR